MTQPPSDQIGFHDAIRARIAILRYPLAQLAQEIGISRNSLYRRLRGLVDFTHAEKLLVVDLLWTDRSEAAVVVTQFIKNLGDHSE